MTTTQTCIQAAPTRMGFEIAIMSDQSYRDGRTFFEVVRCNPEGKFVVIDRTWDEAKARQLANKHWLADMGRPATNTAKAGCRCGSVHTGPRCAA